MAQNSDYFPPKDEVDNRYKGSSSGEMTTRNIMRGRVEMNNDPKRIGRVRVRIPSLHGQNGMTNYIPSDACPWARPCIPGISGQDYGTFVIPPVGSYVWILFEDGDTNKPVYIGGTYGDGPEQPKSMGTYLNEDCSMGLWKTKAGDCETPKDVYEGKSKGYPERGVIFKSPKGHTIMYDDTDGKESFTICDRIGQMIKFTCPISADLNKGNGYRRETKLAEKDNQLSKSSAEKISIRSGLNDTDPERTFIDVYRTKVHLKCHDTKSGDYTEALYTPTKITISAVSNGTFSRRTMTSSYIHDEVNGSSYMHMTSSWICLKAARIDFNP